MGEEESEGGAERETERERERERERHRGMGAESGGGSVADEEQATVFHLLSVDGAIHQPDSAESWLLFSDVPAPAPLARADNASFPRRVSEKGFFSRHSITPLETRPFFTFSPV
ncbi:hypothetical protein AOLI_G00321250 [Acnodon oligacanthus]